MRHNQNGRRFRGRNNNNGQNHNHNHNGNRRINPRVHTFDSNGPDVRIRGNALQITEKYLTLARDAQAGGDRVLAESYLQHAEHYQRMLSEMSEEYNRQQQYQHPGNGQAQAANGRQPAQPEGQGDAGNGEQPDVPMNDLDQGFLVGRKVAAEEAAGLGGDDEDAAAAPAGRRAGSRQKAAETV